LGREIRLQKWLEGAICLKKSDGEAFIEAVEERKELEVVDEKAVGSRDGGQDPGQSIEVGWRD
jgi:hypothetical protein